MDPARMLHRGNRVVSAGDNDGDAGTEMGAMVHPVLVLSRLAFVVVAMAALPVRLGADAIVSACPREIADADGLQSNLCSKLAFYLGLERCRRKATSRA